MMETAIGLSGLAGGFYVRPGQSPSILGRRPVLQAGLLTKLLQGIQADAIAERLGLLFNLCGHAHRLAATLLLEQVMGMVPEPKHNAARSQYLHWQTVREHMQRMALDWPMQFGAVLQQENMPALSWSQAPLWESTNQKVDTGAVHMQALQHWLKTQKWVNERGSASGVWADYLQLVQHSVGTLLPIATVRPLRFEHLQEAVQTLENDADFAFCPDIQGRAHETGAWARLDSASAVEADAGTRIRSRWSEVQALFTDQRRLCFGSGRTEKGGFSYVEMSRGSLLHYMRWDAQHARVEDYRVLAPTEWNFHPQGCLARALEDMDGISVAKNQAFETQKALGAAYALDPCVVVQLAKEAEGVVPTKKEAPHA